MPEFKAQGYLKSTRLDKHGAKIISFEFSAKDAVETAKLELMGRDLVAYLPVLLDVTVKIAKDQKLGEDYKNAGQRKTSKTIR